MTKIEEESKFPSSSVLELLTNQCTIRFSGHSTQSCHQASFMPPRCTLTGKEAMASRRAEFIAARGLTTMWEEFEDAKAEWAVEQEAAKAA